MNDAAVARVLANPNIDHLSQIELLDKEDLVEMVKKMISGGISLSFYGKRSASEIEKRVKPRQTRIIRKLCVGTEEEQAKNALIEGENLQALVTLHKYRGQVALILTDPPYNTGEDFRYNDKWDTDPNDPELGFLVAKDDGARHTKWMKAMLPRLKMMKAMLKPSGILAICIDHREMFRLGMLLNEVFGEENRLGILNWQKSAAPRSDNEHVSTSTEYVLVYAKDLAHAKTGSFERTEKDNKRYSNPDHDPKNDWREGNLSARSYARKDDYAIQSPFTGQLHYPAGNGAWRHPKKNILKWLSEWGSAYEERDIRDGKVPALMVKGGTKAAVPRKVSQRAEAKLAQGNWPFVWFGRDGQGRPRVKTYLEDIRKGKVPVTYWTDDDLDNPLEIGSTSWGFRESGRTSDGVSELTSIVGKGHGFQTVKPLKLFKKIIHLWCPPDGLILDPYAGSGTTGHAILEINHEVEESQRRFILIEQGAPDKGDKYAKTLTYQRLKRAISGERVDRQNKVVKSGPKLGGGFRFQQLTQTVDAKAVLAMKKDELVDLVIVSHWDDTRRKAALVRVDDSACKYLVGENDTNNGYFVIWNGGDAVESFTQKSYSTVVQEAKKHGLVAPYYVYARHQIYQSKSVVFHKIPDKILAHLGLNESSDSYNLDD